VTGGSSGIGKSFIERVRILKPEIVICNLSRRSPAKNSSDQNLNHFSCDLSHPAEIDRTAGDLEGFLQRHAPVGPILLINNSGFGGFGRFPAAGLDQELAMVDVNIRAIVHLTGRLLPLLQSRGGAIMNIASVMAFQPTPFSATYGASKAFVLHWTLALNEELRGTKVRALAVCPGTTTTEFFRTAGLADGAIHPALTMTTDEVVDLSLKALAAGRSQIVTGWKNKIYTFAGSKISKPLAARISGKVLGRFRLGKGGA
jgi:short-subunit dehydrogenase